MELARQMHAGTFKVGVQMKEGSMHTHLLASTYPVPFPIALPLAKVQATQSLVTLSI